MWPVQLAILAIAATMATDAARVLIMEALL